MTQIAQLEIELAANVARLTEDFSKAKEQVSSSLSAINAKVTESMRGVNESIASVNEHIKGMQEAFSAISELAIGGAIGEQILDIGKDFAETAEHIKNTSQMTGLTTAQVQELGHAATMTGSSTEAMDTGLRRLTKSMVDAKNGSTQAVAAFKDVGISQAELANASPYEILTKVANAYSHSADNANKSANAQMLFGRSGMELIPLLNQGSKGLEKYGQQAQALGVVLDDAAIKKGEEANEKFKEVGAVMHAAALQVGSALVPAMEKAAKAIVESAAQGGVLHNVMEMVSDTISSAVDIFGQLWRTVTAVGQVFRQVFSAVLDSVMSVFGQSSSSISGMQLFKNMLAVIQVAVISLRVAVQEACAFISTNFTVLGETARTVGRVIGDALTGHWGSIVSDWNAGMAQVENTVSRSVHRMVNIAKQGGKDIGNAVMGTLPGAAAPATQASEHEEDGAKKGSVGGDTGLRHGGSQKSKMSEFEQQLADAKIYYAKTNDLRQMSLEQEIAYWKKILESQKVSSRDRMSIERKVSELELQEMKKTASEHQKLAMEKIEATQKAALSDIAIDAERAKEKVKTGQMTQGQLENLQEQFENQRYQIEEAAQQKRIQLMKGDPNSDPVALQKLLDQLDQITQQHTLKMTELHEQAAKASASAWQKAFKPITQAFDTTVKGMIMGTTTWQKGLQNIFRSIESEFVNMGVKMVTSWIAKEAAKTTATATAAATRTAIEQSANQQGLLSQAATVIKAIMNDAAKTFSGVWAALSGIVPVGPALAAAAAPAAMATVMGVTGSVASSAGGDWMIPTDRMNKVHEKETILPRDKAAGLDRMLQHFNGLQPGSTTDPTGSGQIVNHHHHYDIKAWDGRSMKETLRRNPHLLADAAMHAKRNGFAGA